MKLKTIIAAFALIAFASCGNNAEQELPAEQLVLDTTTTDIVDTTTAVTATATPTASAVATPTAQ